MASRDCNACADETPQARLVLCYKVSMARDAVLNLRVPVSVKDALRRAAAEDHDRGLSAMACLILTEWLAGHEYLRPDRSTKNRAKRDRR